MLRPTTVSRRAGSSSCRRHDDGDVPARERPGAADPGHGAGRAGHHATCTGHGSLSGRLNLMCHHHHRTAILACLPPLLPPSIEDLRSFFED